jgi:hypothetical protein
MMDALSDSKTAQYEKALLSIVRSLPPERVSEIVDFARFLQIVVSAEATVAGNSDAEAVADDEAWDRLLARPEAQALLDKLAHEALAAIESGQARPMIFTPEGKIAPG